MPIMRVAPEIKLDEEERRKLEKQSQFAPHPEGMRSTQLLYTPSVGPDAPATPGNTRSVKNHR